MKFLTFTMYDASKAADVSQASDKFWAKPPPGIKMLTVYACLGMPFSGAPPHTVLGIGVIEAESAEALAALGYSIMLAGATIQAVPILEVPVGGLAKVEKKIRG